MSQSTLGVSSEETTFQWTRWGRQMHRWLSVAFTVAVVVNLIVNALGLKEPALWVGMFTLLPLLLLMFTGLYLFVLPYIAKRRKTRQTHKA